MNQLSLKPNTYQYSNCVKPYTANDGTQTVLKIPYLLFTCHFFWPSTPISFKNDATAQIAKMSNISILSAVAHTGAISRKHANFNASLMRE